MRQKVTASRLNDFLRALGGAARTPVRIFLVGGATAVLFGWRESTIDVDMKVVPDSDSILKLLPALKDRLEMNIELASPDDFIPALPGWEERSKFIQQAGKITFFHYDFYAQALAKIERGHDSDMRDVQAMMQRGLIDPKRLLEFFSQIENELYRYPAINGASFRHAVENLTGNESAPHQ
jgi:hypothetical protein